MLPPQAPPAHVAHANQSAIDTIERLRKTQDWWIEQQADMPDLPATLDLTLAALDAFWEVSVTHTPGLSSIPRRQAFALRLGQVVRDDAALRNNDGTFSNENLDLVRAVALHPGGALPGHLHASELLAGTKPYAGALVLTNDRQPGSVVLFTAEGGWQAFDSLDALYRNVERAMRRQRADSGELPGVGANDIEAVIDTHFLDTRAIDGDVFDTLARRLIARLRERAARAWTLGTPEKRQDALHAALDLHTLLDVHGIVRHRDLALAAKHDEQRLAGQPAAVRDHWRRMASQYRESVYRADDVETAEKLSLEAFTLNALASALDKRGIAVAVQDLRVRLSRRTLENGPIATAISGFAEEELSLLELAYRNVGATDGMQVIHADGSSRSDVSADVLREIVRGLDLPNAYARHLDDAFGDTAKGRQRRRALTGLLKARMAFEAADARLSYHDAGEPRSFRTDLPDRRSPRHPRADGEARVEYGFEVVNAVLEHPRPDGRKRVDGQEIVVHQLTYKSEPLTGVFMIGARTTGTASRVVLYTPDAPDGIAFREFADRDELTRQFLLNRRFEDYLLARLPAEFGEPDPKSVAGKRRFKVLRLNDDRTLGWIFPFLASCEKCTELAEDFVDREVTTDFLDVAYDDAIALARRNANDATWSTSAIDASVAWDVFWNWNLPVQLTRELVGGAVRSVPRTAQAAWRFYDHVKAGESTEAFLAFVDGYTAGLNALPLYTQVPALAGARVRAAAGAHALASSRRNLPAPDTLFPKKYLAKDVTVPASEPASGVFDLVEKAGARTGLIRQDGKLYHVRFDKTHECWRLDQPGNAAGYAPAIERAAAGRWHYRKVGLRGGGNAYEDLYEVQQLLAKDSALNLNVALLSESQRVVLVDTLNRSLPFDDFALTLRARVSRVRSADQLTQVQEQAWNEALRMARAAPSSAQGPTLAQALGLERPRPQALPQAEPQPGPSRLLAVGESPATPDAIGSSAPAPRAWTRPIKPHWRVSRTNWPTHVYAYVAPGDVARGVEGNPIVPSLIRNTDDVVGLPVTTLPPDTPMWQVPADIRRLLPPKTPEAGTLGKASGGWVRISLDHLPTMHPGGAFHQYHLYRVPGVPAGYYLRWTEVSTARQGWKFSEEPLTLTSGQYQVGYPSP